MMEKRILAIVATVALAIMLGTENYADDHDMKKYHRSTFAMTISSGAETVSDANNASYTRSESTEELGDTQSSESLIAVKVDGCPRRIEPYRSAIPRNSAASVVIILSMA